MKYIFTLLLSLLLFSVKAQYTPETAIRLNCAIQSPQIPLIGNPITSGIDYGCMNALTNTVWTYFTVCDTTDLEIMFNTNGISDTMSAALYGPFSDTTNIISQLNSATPAQCWPFSYYTMGIHPVCNPGVYYIVFGLRPSITTINFNLHVYFSQVTNNTCNSFCSLCNSVVNLRQDICTIDLDVLTQRNKIIWEKGDITNVSGYVLFRENNVSNQFDSLTTIPVNNFSEYVDLTANPASRIWRYKFAAIDLCGNVPDISSTYERYTTLHLQQGVSTTNSINLSWNNSINLPPFPGYGGWVQTIFIYRGSNMNSMQLIDSVPMSFTAYTDVNPMPGVNFYQLEMRKLSSCTPSMLPNNAKSGSNFISPVFTGVAEVNPSLRFSIQPNPAKEYFKIVLSNEAQQLENTISIITIDGKKVAEFNNVQHNQQILTGTFASGAYIAELSNMKGISRKNLIIQ